MATLQTDDSDQPKTDRWIMLDAFCQSQTKKAHMASNTYLSSKA